jgi:photosystem II stability/assembly factor-like uncharacterized protein
MKKITKSIIIVFKLGLIIVLLNCSLLILSIENCFAQYNQQSCYLPQYNLWLPGSNPIKEVPPFGNDSVLYWRYVQTPLIYAISDIFFIDSLYGWATHANGGVLRTSNSGFNWDTTQLVNGAGPDNGIFFINSTTGWTVGVAGLIRKSTNGGLNWINQDFSVYAEYYNSVHFFNEDTGIVIGSKNGSYGYIIRTTNGGNNWNEIFLLDSLYTELRGQFWLNIDTGWICGYNRLLKTTNGGVNFVNYYSNIPPTQNGVNALNAIFFVNIYTGWIGGSNIDRKNIYKTTNGGLNWVFQDNPAAQFDFPQINDIKFISSDSGWAAHGTDVSGIILFTSNGGNNWIIDNDHYSWYWHLSIYNRTKIWCTGDNGRIWYAFINGPVGISREGYSIPKDLTLFQNYPNPFNPSTKIKFSIPPELAPTESGKGVRGMSVQIAIYDLLGRKIATLVNQQLKPGTYEVEWDGSKYASGVYFYLLEAGDFVESKKMLMIK